MHIGHECRDMANTNTTSTKVYSRVHSPSTPPLNSPVPPQRQLWFLGFVRSFKDGTCLYKNSWACVSTPFPLFYTLICTLLLPLDVISWTLLFDTDMEAGLSFLTASGHAFIRHTRTPYNTVLCCTGPQ